MSIEELTSFTQDDFNAVSLLMKQLNPAISLTEQRLRAVVEAPSSHMYVIREDGRIVACATLCLYEAPSNRKAAVEDVVVAEQCRGRRMGRALVEHILSQASQYAPLQLQLTSRPARVAANRLYCSLGLEMVDTNCYRLDFN